MEDVDTKISASSIINNCNFTDANNFIFKLNS